MASVIFNGTHNVSAFVKELFGTGTSETSSPKKSLNGREHNELFILSAMYCDIGLDGSPIFLSDLR